MKSEPDGVPPMNEMVRSEEWRTVCGAQKKKEERKILGRSHCGRGYPNRERRASSTLRTGISWMLYFLWEMPCKLLLGIMM